jgi:hypothetical protein
MSGVALFSMAYKPDFKPAPTRTAHPEMTIIADPRLVSYSIKMSQGLVHNYMTAHPQEKAHVSAVLTPGESAASEVTSLEREEWHKVSVCEEGGVWHGGAPGFDGLGETAKNWDKNGGQQFAPYGYEATINEEIVEAELIRKDPPDQTHCQKGGW